MKYHSLEAQEPFAEKEADVGAGRRRWDFLTESGEAQSLWPRPDRRKKMT